MGGGYEHRTDLDPDQQGLSPHGRGMHRADGFGDLILGPIPAWAGDTWMSATLG